MEDIDFEKRLERSKEILDKLMKPDITLTQSISLYKDGLNELKEASRLLEEVKLSLSEYQKSSDSEREI